MLSEWADAVSSFDVEHAVNGGTGAATGVTVVVASVVLAFDFGLGQAIKEEEPTPPAPRDAALKLMLEGDDRDEHKLIVEGLSGLPPADPVDLVSEDGRKTATVTIDAEDECDDVTDRRNAGYTGPGETAWCLQFADAPDHGAMTGVAKGVAEANSTVPATKLALTLSTRDGFLWLPLAVVAGGILASLLIAAAGALWLPAVAENRLARLLARGENISGLATRAKELREKGKSAAEIVSILAPLVDKGPERAAEARAALLKALTEKPLPAGQAYQAAATAEGNRTDHKVGDFLAADGTPVDHPAHKFEAGLVPMRAYHDQLTAAMKEIEDRLQPPCQREPRTAYEAAELAWSRVEKPDDIAKLEANFDEARTTLDLKLAPSANCLKPGVAGASAEWRDKAEPIDTTLPTGKLLGAVGRWSALLALLAATIVALVVAVLLAGFGVWLATYDPVKTLGSWRDYAALATAALATGVVANVTAILRPWKGAAE